MAYLRGHFVPEDDKEEKRMALRACNYRIINGDLYRGVCAPLLKCISREEADSCSKRFMQACGLRILRRGHWQAKLFAKVFTGLRRWQTPTKLFAHALIAKSIPTTASFPRTKFTSYLQCGPSPDGASTSLVPCPQLRSTTSMQQQQCTTSHKYAGNYIVAAALQKFFWQNVLCCFGVPKEVTIDNGKKIDCTTFREFCSQLGTMLCIASVYL